MAVDNQKEKSSIATGAILGEKYQVDYIVGQGGMGTVYAVTHVELGRKAAIKTLLPKFLQDETVAKRFRQEAQMAASIGHDNICEVIDIATTKEGMTYMIMPLLAGSTFSDLLDKRTLPLEAIVDIVSQTLAGLGAAHRINIVHRDLKPDNIFVTKIGDRDNFVKLLDFGISKILDQETVTKLTQTGTMLGTPYYMSPDQAKGDDYIDHRVDIYAIGVILYEALTGMCPFQGTSYNQVMYKILAGLYVPPSKLNPTVPEPIEQVVSKAMANNKADRYETAEEMRQALNEALVQSGQHAYAPPRRMEDSDISDLVPAGLVEGIVGGALKGGAILDHMVGSSDTVAASPSAETAFPTPSALATTAGSPESPMPVQTPPFQNGVRSSVSQITPLETVSPVSKKRKSLTGVMLVLAVLVLSAVLYILWKERQRTDGFIVPIAEPPALRIAEPQNVPDLLETELELGPDDETKTADKRKKRKKKKRPKEEKEDAPLKTEPDRATAKQEPDKKKPDSETEKTVKGRFGTKFTSDY